MVDPTQIVEKSPTRQQLQAEFESIGDKALRDCLAALGKVEFYRSVLNRLERGVAIEDEVPEARGHTAEEVKQAVINLLGKSTLAAKDAWELSSGYRSCFVTTIRTSLPEGELIPQYDVEHAGQVEAGLVKIRVKSWRRNLTVEIEGSDRAVEQLWIAMSTAVLRAV